MSNKKLGEILVEAGILTNPQLMEALKDQKIFGGRLGSLLLERCMITETVYLDTLSKMLGIPAIDLEGKKISEIAIKTIPMESAWNHMMFPVEIRTENGKSGLVLAMADPTDAAAIKEAQAVSGYKIIPALSLEVLIRHALMDYYQNQYGHGDYTLPRKVVPRCEDSSRFKLDVSDARVSMTGDTSFLMEHPETFKTALNNAQSFKEMNDEFKQALIEDLMLEKIARAQHEINALLRLMSKKGIINAKEFMETLREIKAEELLKAASAKR